MAQKAVIAILVYKISVNNLSFNSLQWKKVVNSVFEQLQNSY